MKHIGRVCSRGHTFTGSDPCPACWPGYRTFNVRATVWLYPGMAGWHFITLPKKQSKEIRERFGDMKRGWGSLPVTVAIGKTRWQTSIFPDKKADAYLLALKAAVRKQEKIAENDSIRCTIEVRV